MSDGATYGPFIIVSDPPTQSKMRAGANKVDELIAMRRA
jgi:hypothetical protein